LAERWDFCFRTNRGTLVIHFGTKGHEQNGVAIDVGEAEAVFRTVQTRDVRVKNILTTHKHWDHSGGVADFKSLSQMHFEDSVVARASAADFTPGHDVTLACGETLEIGGMTVRVLSASCHTRGHVAFYIEPQGGEGVLFTGDSLFVGMISTKSSIMGGPLICKRWLWQVLRRRRSANDGYFQVNV